MPIFAFFVLFALWSMYEIRKASNARQARTDAFWAEEREANNVRRQDISQLDYVVIPYDQLPFDDAATGKIATYQDNIKKLDGAKILNLTGYSNTELKLEYGAPNLPELTEYDSNYTKLVSSLARWAQELYDTGNIADAKTLFEYGIEINTDVSNNYLTLARIYFDENQIDKIYDLMDQAAGLKSLMKDSIVEHLRELLTEDGPDTLDS